MNQVRGKDIPATVTKMPFVPTNYFTGGKWKLCYNRLFHQDVRLCSQNKYLAFRLFMLFYGWIVCSMGHSRWWKDDITLCLHLGKVRGFCIKSAKSIWALPKYLLTPSSPFVKGALWGIFSGRDASPRNPQKCSKSSGKIKVSDTLESFQFRKTIMKQYDNILNNDYDHNNDHLY